jgi:pilus assembly protein CpaB
VNENLIDVVVAKETIKKNQIVQSGMLEIKQVPILGLHPQTVKQFEDVVGSYAISDIESGEVLLSHRVKSEKDETELVSRKVHEGYLAASVGLNIVRSVSNLIEPEDYVDVLHTSPEQADRPAITTIVLEKIRVLAVGRRMIEVDSENPYVEYSSVTLEIKPEDRIKLIHANETGTISLVLHSRQNANIAK